MKTLRLGIVGLGRISEKHFEAIEAHSDRATVVSGCDVDARACENASVRFPTCVFYPSLDRMLVEGPPLDLITICTPSGLHVDHAMMAARNGTPVMVEKPMAINLQSARQLVQACNERQVPLFVVKQNRFNPTLRNLRSAMRAGRFGKIYMIVANVFWTRPQSYYDQGAWRGTWALDGGAFMNQASHYVDLVQWLGGPVESVHAMTATLARKIEAEDTGVCSMRFESGTIGNINVTMLTYPKNLEGSITVIGEKGTAKIAGVALNELVHWVFQEPRPEDETVFSGSYSTDSVYGKSHTPYYSQVLHFLTGGDAEIVNGQEGLKTMAILEAIYRSARDHKEVLIRDL